MTVRTGPLALALPDWGIPGGRVLGIVADGGSAEKLTAQMLLGAAVSGVRTLVLLSGEREADPVWASLRALLGGEKEAAQALAHLPLAVHTGGTGRDLLGGAGLVYAPSLSRRELAQLRARTRASVVTAREEGADAVIQVAPDRLTLQPDGTQVPVRMDSGNLMYLPAAWRV